MRHLSKALLVRKICQVYFMKIQQQKATVWLIASFPLAFPLRDCFSTAQRWALGHSDDSNTPRKRQAVSILDMVYTMPDN